MEFTGAQSIGILNRQRPECLVEIGRDFVEPAVAAKVAATGGYIGVGHHRCIKYLRPSNKAPFRALALLREAMPEHIIPAKVSGRPQIGLRWLPQLSKAKLGCGGSVAANLLGSRVGRSGPAYIDAAAFGQTGRTTDSDGATLVMTSAELTRARTERLLGSGSNNP